MGSASPERDAVKARGGLARAEVLTPEQRKEIARKAAEARWRSNPPRATHSGTLHIGDIHIPCFVLEDGTRVISGRGMTTAIGMKGRGQGAARITVHKTIAPFLPYDLKVAIERPLQFIGMGSRKSNPTAGYEATILHGLCEAILTARDQGALKTEQERRYGKYCEILVRSLAKVGIIALVDEATGYQGVRPQDALQVYLQKLIRKELAAWVKRFPDEFYENIYKLKGWTWPGMQKNRYSVVAHYTRDLVYERIAPGLLEELERKSPPNEKGRRPNRLHQWLTEDIGNPMLAQHLHSLMMFQRLALNSGFGWNRFLRMVDKVMPKRGNTLDLPFPDEELAKD
jgi:hypothetical protein